MRNYNEIITRLQKSELKIAKKLINRFKKEEEQFKFHKNVKLCNKG